MPIPVLIWIAAAALLAGTVVALNWDVIQQEFKGKRLAVLGARGVGKTHLVKFLTTGSIPTECPQTLAPEKAPGRRFQLKDLEINILETLDISGSKDAYSEWKEQHDKADVVFYLLRADRLIAGDTDVEVRVRNDLRHIGGWLEAREPRPCFFIIGTHCDCDPGFAGLSPNKRGDYVDKFKCLPIISELVILGGGDHNAKVVPGSMKTVQDTEELVYQIFMQVTS